MNPGGDPALPTITVAAMTHVGRVRSTNEDAVAAAGAQPLCVVADGMGGHMRGAWAARTVCEAVSRVRLTGAFEADCVTVAAALSDANDVIYAEGERGGATIGTTVAALLLADGRYACLWAGDSRIYLWRDRALLPLTTDNSHVEELVVAGLVDRKAARDHPLGHLVTRAIGVVPGAAVDLVTDILGADDVFLLCSDGLTKVLEDAAIAAVLASHPPEAACRELIRLTLEGGAPDNVSIVIVGVPHR